MGFANRIKSSTLVAIAGGVFLMGSTGLYFAQKAMQRKVRKLPQYTESLRIVATHAQALEALGPPIQLGHVNLSDRQHNYVAEEKSMLRIPVTGSIDGGQLDVYAVRGTPEDSFKTAKIQLILNDGTFTLYDAGLWVDEDKGSK